jgi:nickel-dependent lactate racemase
MVRAVIERAAALVEIPKLAFCLVVHGEGLAGLYIGEPQEAWGRAADHSARTHITYLDRPMQRVLSLMPRMYDDMWTAAKGMYKVEPIVADGGEVIIYAPGINEVSYTYGEILERIGYHVRDYFVKQWDRFKHYPWGVLAHSTHLRGLGEYDLTRGIERPRIRVTLATALSGERCARINLGYADPRSIDPEDWLRHSGDGVLVVPKAGERLYRLRSDNHFEL